ncbi:MAG: 4-hydroxythreonine-4-phosphate dehydrogenase PdxA [Candidatus Omnitrophica bacterium]|nr:4-hydroxythreonine-4-phosphate dehydrogenase PdxA [Candidatus Omnitrophota bacterium]
MKLAVTLGDPAGIGPEVTLKALRLWKRPARVQVLLIGKALFFRRLSSRLGLDLSFADIQDLSGRPSGGTGLPCYFSPEPFPERLVYGRSDKRWTSLAVRSIEMGVRLAMARRVQALVTPPINKAGLKKAGFDLSGHTEYLARLSGAKRFEMMLVGGKLKAALVTRHIALKDVSKFISKKRVEEAILLTAEELKRSFGIRRPRIVVCGLNPHAGEEGNFGREEIEEIIPAVRSAGRKTDAEIIGPLSPDALFHDAYKGFYDAEICMYHDQGLIPLKMIARGSAVNVTLGLPFVRTSPDHGTAYDIAGQGKADPGSMLEAMKLAVELCENRRKPYRAL